MTQNIYDNEDFFEGYSRLPRSVRGLAGAPEWPALVAMLPDLRDRRVLDLGCGFGWFCRWAREQGAARVAGVDVSERMLARARAATDDPAISYTHADLDGLRLPPHAFDLVYSSLAFHYLERLDDLVAQVSRALVPGGRLIFSVEHPMITAPINPAWSTNAAGERTWPVSSYLLEGPRTTDWIAKGVIKQHRTFTTYCNMLVRHGFTIAHVEEWGPTDEDLAADPALADERDRPTFLLLSTAVAAQPL